jgi:hypothetical protein
MPEMVDRHMGFLNYELRIFFIRTVPHVVRCRIKPEFLNRFANLAFHNAGTLVYKNPANEKKLFSSGFFLPQIYKTKLKRKS